MSYQIFSATEQTSVTLQGKKYLSSRSSQLWENGYSIECLKKLRSDESFINLLAKMYINDPTLPRCQDLMMVQHLIALAHLKIGHIGFTH